MVMNPVLFLAAVEARAGAGDGISALAVDSALGGCICAVGVGVQPWSSDYCPPTCPFLAEFRVVLPSASENSRYRYIYIIKREGKRAPVSLLSRSPRHRRVIGVAARKVSRKQYPVLESFHVYMRSTYPATLTLKKCLTDIHQRCCERYATL